MSQWLKAASCQPTQIEETTGKGIGPLQDIPESASVSFIVN